LLAGVRPPSAVAADSPAAADTPSIWAALPANASHLWEYLGYYLVLAGQDEVLTVLRLQ